MSRVILESAIWVLEDASKDQRIPQTSFVRVSILFRLAPRSFLRLPQGMSFPEAVFVCLEAALARCVSSVTRARS